MPVTCVVGLQWGDEAKGKVVDLLTGQHEICVRYQGGSNAGHTVVFDGESYKLSLVPSGIFHAGVKCVITGGVVLNPKSFLGELDGLTSRGIALDDKMLLSDRAHLVMPWHFEEDRLLNAMCGSEAIGTTMRGIGPCYRDKVGRSFAVRLGDLYRDGFADQIARIVEAKRSIIAGLGAKPDEIDLDASAIVAEYLGYAEQLKGSVGDTTAFLLDAVEADKKILFEGAQGALLDIDHGTFPFVTSSNSSGVGVSSGSGVAPCHIKKVVGIIKAYTTRVGGGPFPTEQDNEIGQHIRDIGNEYGTVTKRPRRCGWFDAVAARYTSRLSGVDRLAIMLVDVLSELPEIKICTAYELDGKTITDFPSHVDDIRRVKPVYETLPGWQTDITGIRTWDELPENTKSYLSRISELLGRKIGVVSIGPDREQTIIHDLA
jgi:adenylosuccinate synthase